MIKLPICIIIFNHVFRNRCRCSRNSALTINYLIFRKNTLNPFELYSYSFILGGTIGNGIDRIYKGFVVDFINLNIINFPVFNIADISINIGFIFLIYNIFKNR